MNWTFTKEEMDALRKKRSEYLQRKHAEREKLYAKITGEIFPKNLKSCVERAKDYYIKHGQFPPDPEFSCDFDVNLGSVALARDDDLLNRLNQHRGFACGRYERNPNDYYSHLSPQNMQSFKCRVHFWQQD